MAKQVTASRAEVQLASTFDRGARAWNADVVYK